MKKAQVTVSLSDKGSLMKEWERPCETDLPEVVEALRNVKLSLNDYLTHLINHGRDLNFKEQRELGDISDEEDDIEGDSVSGFIKNTAVSIYKSKECAKRKITDLNQSKKLRM